MFSSLVLIALLTPGLAQQPLLEPDKGSIAGVVLEQTGTPLADATVFALPEQDMRRQIRTQTDAQGRFVLKNLPVGGAYIHAYKESAGYPYSFFAFFAMPGQEPPPKVDVRPGQTTTGVTIRMGVKAAALKLKITDSTGAPLTASAAFERPDMGRPGNYSTGLEAEQVLLVPPVPFRMTVRRDGYADWRYIGSDWREPVGLVSLRPGETRELAIVLQLTASASATASTGTIQGTVLGAADEPIAGATVQAAYIDGDTRRRRTTRTTHAGTCVLNNLEPGNVHLSVYAAGYSKDLALPFFDVPGRQFPVVAAVAGEVASTEVRLGPKTASLHLLIEDTRGQAVQNVRVTLSRADSPELFERDVPGGRDFLPVPAVPLRIAVDATGYAPWRSDDQAAVKDQLSTLTPGQIVDIRVTLRGLR
jgi:hypothetical protein